MDKPFVNISNTYRADQSGVVYGKVISQIQKDGVCPFCPEQFARYHKNPILRDGAHWLATDNMYPYEGAKHHVLFIHKKHIEHVEDVGVEAWAELHEFVKWLTAERGIRGGTFFMRFGDTNYTGASVSHLHANLVSPDVDKPDRKPVIARIG